MQIKITMRHHIMPVRMVIIYGKTNKQETSDGEDVEKLEPLHSVGGNAKWFNCYRKQSGAFSKI